MAMSNITYRYFEFLYGVLIEAVNFLFVCCLWRFDHTSMGIKSNLACLQDFAVLQLLAKHHIRNSVWLHKEIKLNIFDLDVELFKLWRSCDVLSSLGK